LRIDGSTVDTEVSMKLEHLAKRAAYSLATFFIGLVAVWFATWSRNPASYESAGRHGLQDQLTFRPQIKPENENSGGMNTLTDVKSQSLDKEWRLVRRHLDKLFSIDVPIKFRKPDDHADVDGGFFMDDSININYDYWLYQDTPNFMRDINGKYSKKPDLRCIQHGRDVRTSRIILQGRLAYVQQCRLPSEHLHYVIYLTMPKAKVRDVDEWGNGVFNLDVSFNDRKLFPIAKRIIYSLRFERK
jgi:hypothetical protein